MPQPSTHPEPSTNPPSSAASSRRGTALPTVLRVLGALTLGYSGYLHLRIAVDRPPLYADGQVTLSGLFIAQAVAAAIVVIWVLVRGTRLAWLAFAAVAAGSLAALVLSVYVQIPSVGPFPIVYEPVWYQDKYLAAGSAAAATIIAVAALIVGRRRTP